MLWLSIHFPLLPLEIFLDIYKPDNSKIFESEPAGESNNPQQAAAVVQDTRGKPIILAVNEQANEYGITPGMSHSTALAMHSETKIINRQLEKELNTLQNLAETAYEFSSQIIVYSNQKQQHSLLLEISRSLRLFDGISTLKNLIHQAFSNHPLGSRQTAEKNVTQGFSISMATANTPRLSEIMSRYYLIKTHQDSDAKNSIPLSLLDCEEKAKEQCLNMGIHTLKQIMAIPRDAMGRRLPKNLIIYLNQLDGSVADPLPTFKPKNQFKQNIYFNYGIKNHDELHHPMDKLLKSLRLYLRTKQLQCTKISWRFFNVSKKSMTTTIHFTKPQISADEMLGLSQLKIEAMDMSSAIEDIQLFSNEFIPMSHDAIKFFDDIFMSDHSENKEAIKNSINGDAKLLQNRIQARLGSSSIKTIKKTNSHLPEKSNKARALKNNIFYALETKKDSPLIKNKDISIQPKWLLNPAKAVSVKQINDDYWLNNRYPLSILKGPSRVQSEWWENHYARDYYIVGVQSEGAKKDRFIKSIYWIYREESTLSWFIHGVF